MSRLSIDLTTEQHQRLKALAALRGKSIRDYVLERALPDSEEEQALAQLETLLKARLASVKKGAVSDRTPTQILEELE